MSIIQKNDEWCESQEIVSDDRKRRCSRCGRRLIPRDTGEFNYQGIIYQLPPHKKKGYKIRRKKGHNKRKNEISKKNKTIKR